MSIRFRPIADQARTAREKGREGGRRGEEEKPGEYKVTFLNAVKGLDMARKYVCQLDFVDYLLQDAMTLKMNYTESLNLKNQNLIG